MGEVVEIHVQVIQQNVATSDSKREHSGGNLEIIGSSHDDTCEDWLPITESRDGNVYSATFHLLCSGIGFQAFGLPYAIANLGWFWGILCLSLGFGWQLYTIWLLVHLHESVSGARYSRYLGLAKAAFGEKLGKALAIFPVQYLSAGTCISTIIVGGGTMRLFYQTMCSDEPTRRANNLTGTECYLIFICLAILMAQFCYNLNSLAWVSLMGAVTAVGYCTLLWVLSVSTNRTGRPSHQSSEIASSETEMIRGILVALGNIALAFRGHNLILEIQGTLPSSPGHPSHKPMWRAVTISYLIISVCLFPLAIGGYWAYGNTVATYGSVFITFKKFHGASKSMMGSIYLLIVIDCLCTFQIYAMPIFDNFELVYTLKKKKKCPRKFRIAYRLFFGGLTFFIAVALPFMIQLGPLIGGITLSLAYTYPCFMWVMIKKPTVKGPIWWFNLCLGCFGVVLSVLVVVSAVWTIAEKGVNGRPFHPR